MLAMLDTLAFGVNPTGAHWTQSIGMKWAEVLGGRY